MIMKLPSLIIPMMASAAEPGAAEGAGAPLLPNLITIISSRIHGPVGEFLHHFENVIYAIFVAVVLSLIAWRASRNRAMVPGPLQNFFEMLVSGLDDFFAGILGHEGRRFTPFLGTLFIYIWCMNLSGIIPGLMSPTGGPNGINTTIALAVCVFFYVQYAGIKKLGLGGYFDHLMGSPRDVISWILVPLNLPIHVIGELAKPLSLSLRLFGNITGEDVLLAAFLGLGVAATAFLNSPIGIPLHLPFMFLAMLTGTIQALVFTLLSSVYFSMMVAEHEEHH